MAITESQLHRLFEKALKDVETPTLLKGFKLDFSANKDFHKLFFASRCSCGTSALLSIEVAKDKTLEEVKEALPQLMGHLQSRDQAFRNMSCEMHARMRVGGRTQ